MDSRYTSLELTEGDEGEYEKQDFRDDDDDDDDFLGSALDLARSKALLEQQRQKRQCVLGILLLIMTTIFILVPVKTSMSSLGIERRFCVPTSYLYLDGGTMVYADESDSGGSFQFQMGSKDDDEAVELQWFHPSDERGIQNRAYALSKAVTSQNATVLGRPALLYWDEYNGFMVWNDENDYAWELRSFDPAPGEFEKLVQSIANATSEQAWLQQVVAKSSVVYPNGDATIQEILQDIPLPSTVSSYDFYLPYRVMDHYQLGADISGEIACLWLEQWFDARTTGDTQAETEAFDAMQSSLQWSILQEMKSQGGYSSEVWGFAQEMKTPSTMDSWESISSGLGCGDRLQMSVLRPPDGEKFCHVEN